MEPFLYIIFLGMPLVVLMYAVMTARRYSWGTYIGIIVFVIFTTVFFVPMLDTIGSPSGNISDNSSKFMEEFFSGYTTDAILNLLPVLMILGLTVFIIWFVWHTVTGIDREPRKTRTRPLKVRHQRKPWLINDKVGKIPPMVNNDVKEKSKDVKTSGWDVKK